ncbi:MAG: hypothetical protein JSV85_00425 [Candidatus Bathyarchaeota archaeon]|nr:MAG: hypothetical protein JSV85_00425 [Candidatus Bathyarchaeota archaeon]
MRKKHMKMRSLGYAIFALGISVCLIGALVMVAGESILGENHAGTAAVIGIVGIGIISQVSWMLGLENAKGRKA